jgi:hypothetical protein
MLRVEMHDAINAFLVKLQGRFTGDDAEHARSLVTRSNTTLRIIVDLTDVIFVDEVGENALQLFSRMGAEFIASNSYALDICERLHLPLAANRTSRVIAPSKLHTYRIEASAETVD